MEQAQRARQPQAALVRSQRPRPYSAGRARSLAEQRRHLRWPVFWRGTLSDADQDGERDCLVLDFSPSGAKIKTRCPPAVGTDVSLSCLDTLRFDGRVAWAQDGLFGIKFLMKGGKYTRVVESVMLEPIMGAWDT